MIDVYAGSPKLFQSEASGGENPARLLCECSPLREGGAVSLETGECLP